WRVDLEGVRARIVDAGDARQDPVRRVCSFCNRVGLSEFQVGEDYLVWIRRICPVRIQRERTDTVVARENEGIRTAISRHGYLDNRDAAVRCGHSRDR